MAEFALHPQLAADTRFVADLPLCRVLLMNDSQYPWLILVPRVANVRDFDELSDSDAALLTAEIRLASRALRSCSDLYKLNVAALGNMVEQLHVHVIARRTDDTAWPRPVWGASPPRPYDTSQSNDFINELREALVTEV